VSSEQRFGIDCGATKVMAQSILYDTRSKTVSPGRINFEYNYSSFPSWDPKFIAIPLKTQRAEIEETLLNIKQAEQSQALVIINTIKRVISEIKSKDIALCAPGLKSNSGVILMANGPRIPNLLNQIPDVKSLYNDSECCLLGEINSTIGRIKKTKNAIYIGGGTGIADGLILNGKIIKFDNQSEVKRSWEIIVQSGASIESNLSPNGMLSKWNQSRQKKINSLFGLEKFSGAKSIFEEASNAFSSLIKNRIIFFNRHNAQVEKIVIGQRLGEFLSNCQRSIRFLFESKTNITIEYSSDRRTAALGAAWKKLCS